MPKITLAVASHAGYANGIVATILKDLDAISKSKVPVNYKVPDANINPVLYDVCWRTLDPTFPLIVPRNFYRYLEDSTKPRADSGSSGRIMARVVENFQQDRTLVAYLLYSYTFRKAIEEEEDDIFSKVFELLRQHRNSVIIFCQLRWLYSRALKYDQDAIVAPYYHGDRNPSPELGLYQDLYEMKGKLPVHPHSLVLTPHTNGTVKLRRHRVELANTNKFDTEKFKGLPRPANFPRGWKWRQDPTLIPPTEQTRCHLCGSAPARCTCEPMHDSRIANLLIDLYEYPGKGIGVRSLSKLSVGTLLGEYIGEIVPITESGGEYCLEIDMVPISANTERKAIFARIDSSRTGNWTRWTNHSCEPNCEVKRFVFGPKIRCMLVAIRQINCFDEITIDYGENYFSLEEPVLLCRCGTASCKYATLEQIRAQSRKKDN